MRLDRYTQDEPRFRVQRRQPDGTYADVDASDYFVLALKDEFTEDALRAYADAAGRSGDLELAKDVERLAEESLHHPRRKKPD